MLTGMRLRLPDNTQADAGNRRSDTLTTRTTDVSTVMWLAGNRRSAAFPLYLTLSFRLN